MNKGKRIHLTILVVSTVLIVLAGIMVPRILLAIKSSSITGRKGSFDAKSVQPYSAHVIERENAIRDELKYYNDAVSFMTKTEYYSTPYTYANKSDYYNEIANNGYYEPMYQLSLDIFEGVVGYVTPNSLPIRTVTYGGVDFLTASSGDALNVVMDKDTGLPLYAKLYYSENHMSDEYIQVYADSSIITSSWNKMIDTYSSILGVRFLGDINSYYTNEEYIDLPVNEARDKYMDLGRVDEIAEYGYVGNSYYYIDGAGYDYVGEYYSSSDYRCAISTDNTIRVNMVVNRKVNLITNDVDWDVELWLDLV